MKKLLSFLLTGLAFVSFIASATTCQFNDLVAAKKAAILYHDSGQYDKDIAKVMSEATSYLKTQLGKPDHTGKKPAVILDIDETSLSNYDNMVKADFGGTLEQLRQAEMQGNDKAIEPTLKFYQFAKDHGVAVFFVTGRHEDELNSTTANLQKAGFSNWNGLIFKPSAYYGKSAAIYKTATRKELTDKGYNIILNIGDQKSDLAGGYAKKTLKLPNPYYEIP